MTGTNLCALPLIWECDYDSTYKLYLGERERKRERYDDDEGDT